MERIQDIDDERVTAVREAAQRNTADQEEFDPLDRTTREHVAMSEDDGGVWKPTALKAGDDVLVGAIQARVIGPARGRRNFLAYARDFGAETFHVFDVRHVADRAPADADEEPMPLVPGHEALPDPRIEQARADAFKKIDEISDLMIQGGFVHRDILFSLSMEAQIRYNAMLVLADTLTYPLDINSLDDRAMLSLQTGDETRAFCAAALAHVKGAVDSGTAEKERVRGLQDLESLQSFEDSRQEQLA